MERTFETEAERFLTDYGADLLRINREHPEIPLSGDRMRAFETLHRQGIHRLRGLVAEFGRR